MFVHKSDSITIFEFYECPKMLLSSDIVRDCAHMVGGSS